MQQRNYDPDYYENYGFDGYDEDLDYDDEWYEDDYYDYEFEDFIPTRWERFKMWFAWKWRHIRVKLGLRPPYDDIPF